MTKREECVTQRRAVAPSRRQGGGSAFFISYLFLLANLLPSFSPPPDGLLLQENQVMPQPEVISLP